MNTFKYTKKLEEAGFSREQAETQLQVITEIVEDDLNFATKQDLKQDLKALEIRLLSVIESKANATEMRFNTLENKMEQLENRLTIKLGTFFVIGFTAMVTLMKLWVVR